MRILIVVGLYLALSGCTSNNEKEDVHEDNQKELKALSHDIEWTLIKESDFLISVPSSWQTVGYSDTISEYFAFKIFEENDSAFFQVSIDNTSLGIDSYLKGEFDLMNSWKAVQTGKYCIEELKLKNKSSVWYAQLDFNVSDVKKSGHFFIIPYEQRLYQLRLSMPAYWDNEWAKYLMSQIAFNIQVDNVEIFKRSEEIQKVEKDCN